MTLHVALFRFRLTRTQVWNQSKNAPQTDMRHGTLTAPADPRTLTPTHVRPDARLHPAYAHSAQEATS